jgi:hypothetical protein
VSLVVRRSLLSAPTPHPSLGSHEFTEQEPGHSPRRDCHGRETGSCSHFARDRRKRRLEEACHGSQLASVVMEERQRLADGQLSVARV